MGDGSRAWRIGLGALAIGLAWVLRDIVVLVALALLFSAALTPAIAAMERWGLPRSLGVSVAMLALLGSLVGFGLYVAPLVADQASEFARALPALTEQVSRLEDRWAGWHGAMPFVPRFQEVTGWLTGQIETLARSVLDITGRFVGLVVAGITVLFLMVFILLDGRRLGEQLLALVPVEARDRTRTVLGTMYRHVGHYMLGRLAVMAAVGVATGIGLTLLGVPYAVVLGLVAGLLDIVPYIGPILAAVPGVLVGLGTSFEMGVWVALMYWAVQSLESYVLSPLIVGRTVGLHPVWVFVGLLVGEAVYGLVGAVLAIPAAVALQVLIHEVYLPYLDSRHEARMVRLGDVAFPARERDAVTFADRPAEPPS